MMRNLKFRAWDTERKRMYYQDKEKWMLSCRASKEGNEFELHTSCYVNNIFTPEMGALMQYTGLKDMDGKEIYENDVLHLSYGCPPTAAYLHVVFKDASFKVLCSNSHPRENLLSEVELSDCYVQGNIYENPELLEETK